MRFPNFIQTDARDCGPTCLQIIAKYYGEYHELSELRRLMETGREGSSVLDIINAAQKINIRCTPYSISFFKFRKEAPLPVIVHWKQTHFLVVYKITEHHIYVSDPGAGLYRMTLKDFASGWLSEVPGAKTKRGVCITCEPTPEFGSEQKNAIQPPTVGEALSWISRYLKPYRKESARIMSVMFILAIIGAVFPIITQSIIDTGIPGRDYSFIGMMLSAMIALSIGRILGIWLQGAVTVRFSVKMRVSMVSDYLMRLMRLPMEYFEKRLMGDIIQRNNDFDRIESMVSGTIFPSILALFNLLLFGTILAIYDLTLFWVFIAGAILYVSWVLFFWSLRKRMDIQYYSLLAKNNSQWIEMLTRIADIKGYGYADGKRWQWERNQTKLYHTRVKLFDLEQIQRLGSGLINAVKDAILIYLSARTVIEGEMTLGMLTSVQYILGQLQSPLDSLVNMVVTLQLSTISYTRVTEVRKTPTENTDGGTNDSLAPFGHPIKLDNITYRYSTDNAAIKGLSIILPYGKTIAIVGESGCGKSTLLKLLSGLYRPTSGQVKIGEMNLALISTDKWRKHCSAIYQDSDLVRDTLYNNIVFGREPSDEKVRRAAYMASIHDEIIAMAKGYDTQIGENGRGISQGQKQRILLARAIYDDPEYIFLDEMTSALDTRNEENVVRSLRKSLPGRLVVIVSHRRKTVESADLVLVLKHGVIAEAGTPERLREKQGEYYRLFFND